MASQCEREFRSRSAVCAELRDSVSSKVRMTLIRITSATALLTSSILGFYSGACGPTTANEPPIEIPSEEGRRYAGALCQAIDACGCARVFATRAECEDEYGKRFDELLTAGLRVSPDCFEAWLQAIETDPCLGNTDLAEVFACAAVQGNARAGARCAAHVGFALGVEECNDGLTCQDASCKAKPQSNEVPWIELGEGAACGPSYVGFCRRDDLYCNPSEGVCRERVPLGSECFDGGCESCTAPDGGTLYCQGAGPDSAGVCAPLPRVGESCDPLDTADCGTCGDVGWCDPASNTCVSGRAPILCRQVHQ